MAIPPPEPEIEREEPIGIGLVIGGAAGLIVGGVAGGPLGSSIGGVLGAFLGHFIEHYEMKRRERTEGLWDAR
ncbi:MAG: hypothetical protein JSV43_02675 [Methanobacteriota archaeon]|nr:MAG: hypothetical protein JSV43_02675 [Euryarchaeota archaeon]